MAIDSEYGEKVISASFLLTCLLRNSIIIQAWGIAQSREVNPLSKNSVHLYIQKMAHLAKLLE